MGLSETRCLQQEYLCNLWETKNNKAILGGMQRKKIREIRVSLIRIASMLLCYKRNEVKECA